MDDSDEKTSLPSKFNPIFQPFPRDNNRRTWLGFGHPPITTGRHQNSMKVHPGSSREPLHAGLDFIGEFWYAKCCTYSPEPTGLLSCTNTPRSSRCKPHPDSMQDGVQSAYLDKGCKITQGLVDWMRLEPCLCFSRVENTHKTLESTEECRQSTGSYSGIMCVP